jgi:hypothetical protein
MYIEFYDLTTGKAVPTGNFFVYNGNEVWWADASKDGRDERMLAFDDFVIKADYVGWRAVEV